MSLWNLFWSFATVWAAPLIALSLCLRAVVSRDSRGRRLTAVVLAFVPALLPLLARLWTGWTRPPGGLGRNYLELSQFAPVVPAVYLLAWGFRSRDDRWMRIGSAILGLIGLCVPLLWGWARLMK